MPWMRKKRKLFERVTHIKGKTISVRDLTGLAQVLIEAVVFLHQPNNQVELLQLPLTSRFKDFLALVLYQIQTDRLMNNVRHVTVSPTDLGKIEALKVKLKKLKAVAELAEGVNMLLQCMKKT
jgi:hypothetical protein